MMPRSLRGYNNIGTRWINAGLYRVQNPVSLSSCLYPTTSITSVLLLTSESHVASQSVLRPQWPVA